MTISELVLNAEQSAAVKDVLAALRRDGWACLIGHAGTGKTTTMLPITEALARTAEPILTAPTHKAASVLAEKTGMETRTLHSALSLVPLRGEEGERVLTQVHEPDLPPNGVIIVDEASMLSPMMLDCLDKIGLPYLLVGDAAQLPPVGYDSAVFMDHMAGGTVCALQTIMRQAGDNPLPHIAAQWRGGHYQQWPTASTIGDSGGVIRIAPREALQRFCGEAVAHFKAQRHSAQAPVWLTYTNAAAMRVGSMVRHAIYGDLAYSKPYMPDEKVMVCSAFVQENVIVLPMSRIVTIATEPQRHLLNLLGHAWELWAFDVVPEGSDRTITVAAMPPAERGEVLEVLRSNAMNQPFGERRDAAWGLFYDIEDSILDLRTIYTSTTHKAQGSTMIDVYLDSNDMDNRNAMPIRNNLVYTALTRPTRFAYVCR